MSCIASEMKSQVSGSVMHSKVKASRGYSRRHMNKCEETDIQHPCRPETCAQWLGVLWRLRRDGFLYVHPWIVQARAKFSNGTWLALMIPRGTSSGHMGF